MLKAAMRSNITLPENMAKVLNETVNLSDVSSGSSSEDSGKVGKQVGAHLSSSSSSDESLSLTQSRGSQRSKNKQRGRFLTPAAMKARFVATSEHLSHSDSSSPRSSSRWSPAPATQTSKRVPANSSAFQRSMLSKKQQDPSPVAIEEPDESDSSEISTSSALTNAEGQPGQ